MSAIGPDLPPHLLAKRKRQQEVQTEDATVTASGASKQEASPEPSEKRRRVIGPAMPPAALDERPIESAPTETSESEEDDDFGPALPTDGHGEQGSQTSRQEDEATSREALNSDKLRRDDWMTMAPTQDNLAASMDPTRIRARGFATGRAARGGGNESSSNAAWHETAEQKQKRLANEVLGITSTTGPPTSNGSHVNAVSKDKATRDEQTAQRLRDMEKHRGPSLVSKHRQDKPDKVDDDPSKRAFDREKDMGSASRITGVQKRDLINKASGYSSRFSGGSYL